MASGFTMHKYKMLRTDLWVYLADDSEWHFFCFRSQLAHKVEEHGLVRGEGEQ